MARCVLLRGNSGSGKSTVARLLQRRLGRGTLMIPQDMVRREMLYARDGAGTPTVALMIELARWGAANCESVIVEGILDAEVYAPLFDALRETFDPLLAFYYDLPFEETLRRHATKPNHADFGEADMRRWWKERDLAPGLSEEILTADVSAEAAVEQILKQLDESARARGQ